MSDRDKNGRFTPGNEIGKNGGRPRREVEADYLAVTIASVSLAEWKRIVKKAAAQAERGDAKAREWLGKYLLGNPEQPLSGEIVMRVVYGDDNQAAPTPPAASGDPGEPGKAPGGGPGPA